MLIFSAAITFVVACGCRRANEHQAPPQPGEPSTRTEHFVRVPSVFGDETRILSHTLTVRNDTGRPVRFVNVQQSCSCTGAELGTRQLDPEQETTLRFNVQAYGRSGEQRFVCTLIDDAGSAWVYGVETTIYVPERFAETGVNFGMVDPNSSNSLRTDFLISSRDPVGVDRRLTVVSFSESIHAVVGEAIRDVLPDGVHRTRIPVEVRLRATARPGVGQGTFRVRFEGDKRREWTQQVSWNVRSLFVAEPRQVFFGAVEHSAEPLKQRVILRRADGQPLKVKTVRVPGIAVEAAVEATAAGKNAELTFLLTPSRLTRTLWEEAEVETDHPIQPIIKIPIACVLCKTEPATEPNDRK